MGEIEKEDNHVRNRQEIRGLAKTRQTSTR